MGAAVTDAMGRQAPEGLIGIHTNLFVPGLARRLLPEGNRARSAPAAEAGAAFRATGFGYFLEQTTRPQTIGYALLDSPVALAAWMLDHDTDSYYKISRAFVDGQPVGQSHPRPHPRQHHALLADRHRGLGGPLVLGERTSHSSRGAARLLRRSPLPVGIHHVPGRDRRDAAQLGRAGLPDPHLLQQGRQGRALRRLGRARAVLHRDARGVPVTPLRASPITRR